MPIELNQFFQQAAGLQDNAQVYAASDNVHASAHSQLHGIHKLSVAAHKDENRATVQAFKAAILADPRYQELASLVSPKLDALIAQGKPLTASTIRQTQLLLSVERGMLLGKDLATAGVLPAGHGSSFGQYAVAHNLSLDTREGVTEAIKSYLLHEVAPKNLSLMTSLPNMAGREKAAQIILAKLNPDPTGENGLLGKTLDTALAHGFENFRFGDLEGAYVAQNQTNLEILRHMNPESVNNIANMDTANVMATLHESLPELGFESAEGIFKFITSNLPELGSANDRAICLANFMLNQNSQEAGSIIAIAHDLPGEFGSALAFHPDVQNAAKAMLAQDPGLGVIPTQDRVNDVILQATEAFTKAHEAILQEFAIMANDPPVDLNPPLNPANMARYINTMLAGDDILQALLSDNVPMDAAFMDKVGQLAHGMNSAAHSMKGDFGADDVAGVLRNSIFLLMSRRGVSADMYPAMMERAISKFGKMSSELATLNRAVQNGYGDSAGLQYLKHGLSTFRALEGFSRALINAMPHEQLVQFHVISPNEPALDEAVDEPTDKEMGTRFMEENFQKFGELEELPEYMREFARHNGLSMPSIDPAVAARVETRRISEQQAALETANHQAQVNTLNSLSPDTGQVREAVSPTFQTLFAQIAASHDLTGIDPQFLQLKNPAMRGQMEAALKAVVDAANAQGVPVAEADMQAAVEASLTQSLLTLKATLDSISALPEPGPQGFPTRTLFSAEQKTRMKELVQSSGLRDIDTIKSLSYVALRDDSGLKFRNIGIPSISAYRLCEECRSVGQFVLEACHVANIPETEKDSAIRFVVQLSIKNAQLSPEKMQLVFENMQSPVAQEVAGAILAGQDLPEMTPQIFEKYAVTHTVMNEIRMMAGLGLGHAVEDNAQFLATKTPLLEIPRGTNSSFRSMLSSMGAGKGLNLKAIANNDTPMTEAEWKQIDAIMNNAVQRVSPGFTQAYVIRALLGNASPDLLAIIRQKPGVPLSDAQVWQAVMGEKMPSGASGKLFGERLCTTFVTRYEKLFKAAKPEIDDRELKGMCEANFDLCVRPQKMLELCRPGARLSLTDMRISMEMSSLSGYHAGNAFGLTTDFPRRDPGTQMELRNVQGEVIFQTRPYSIPAEENKPTLPHYQTFIAHAGAISQSDAQMARVMESFSQAACISPRLGSRLFPGITFSEHGNFSVTATQQADGTVVVDMSSDPALPLVLTQQFLIQPDGSHTCTAFEMFRPAE